MGAGEAFTPGKNINPNRRASSMEEAGESRALQAEARNPAVMLCQASISTPMDFPTHGDCS